MARSRFSVAAAACLAVLLVALLVTACSSPTRAPGSSGTAVPSGSGFSAPPGPVGVPGGDQGEAYPGNSIENFPTAQSAYPAPGEKVTDEAESQQEGEAAEETGEADEGGSATEAAVTAAPSKAPKATTRP
jgi:hypothetical protein